MPVVTRLFRRPDSNDADAEVTAALADIALDLAKRELDGQATVLAAARTRAAAYITASFAMTVFFGPLTLRGDLSPFTQVLCALMVVLFVVAVAAAIAVTNPSNARRVPRTEGGARLRRPREAPFRFALGARWVLGKDAPTAAEAKAAVALDLERLYDDNQPLVERALGTLRVSGAAVLGQLSVWGLMLLAEEVIR